MELVQIRLLVSDFESCYRFYADVLGLTPQSGRPRGPYEKFSAPIGGAAIALQDRAMMAQTLDVANVMPAGLRSLVVLRVDDVDAFCADVVRRGGELLAGPGPMTDRMRVAHLADPAGNVVEIQQWLSA